MSVRMKPQTGRFAGRTVPVLMPLYRTDCGSWQFTEDGDYRCGAAAHCDIQIEADGIAPEHCDLNYRAGHLSVRRGQGRVWVNELPVQTECSLSPGDTLSFGAVSFRIDEAESQPRASSALTESAPARPVPASVAAPLLPPHAPPVPASVHTLPVAAPYFSPPPVAVTPPPIPGVVPVADSSELQEKLRAVAEQKSALDARERQLHDSALASREREQSLLERQQALDDRSTLLSEQKAALTEQVRTLAEQQSTLSTLEQSLRKQKADLDRRLRQLDDRELDLDTQSERHASLYADLERSRVDLQQQADRLKARETELDAECRRVESRLQESEASNSQLQTDLQARSASLDAREQQLKNHAVEVDQKYILLQSELRRLETLGDEIRLREQDCAQREAKSRSAAEEMSQREQQLTVRMVSTEEHARLTEARTRDLEARIAAFDLMVNSTEETLHCREAAVHAQAESISRQDAEQSAVRAELDQLRNELEQTRQSLTEREQLIDERSKSLEAQAQKMLEQPRQSDTGEGQAAAVEQLAALHSERESLLRLRQEVLDAQDDLRRQQSALTARSQEVEQLASSVSEQRLSVDTGAAELQNSRAELAARQIQVQEQLALANQAAELRLDLMEKADALAAQEAQLTEERDRLNEWTRELESRSDELANRIATIKSHRRQTSSLPAVTISAVDPAIDEELSRREQVLRTLQLELMERQSSLELEQQRLTLERDLARQQTLAAESEREALQVAHKSLLCERNSVSQSVQDLKTREQAVRDLETKLNRQSDDIASRIVAVEHQVALLRSRENELEARSVALHRNVQDFKLEMAEQRRRQLSDYVSTPEGEDDIPKDTQLTELAELLHTAERQRDGVTAERDAMLAAVRELQKALTDARDDVEEAAKLRSEVTRQSQELAKLYSTLEEKNAQLQISEARIAQEEEKVTALSLRLCQSSERISGSAAEATVGPNDDLVEAKLLAELETMRAELAQASQIDHGRLGEFQQQLTERNRLIADLQEELERLRRQTESVGPVVGDSASSDDGIAEQLKTRLAETESSLKERDEIIRELQSRLTEQVTAEPVSRDSLLLESKELDRRALVLDDRDEQLRERQRKLEQSEGEVEQQRRELLEARQQLEQARAEIQMAMRQHSSQPPTTPAGMNTQVVRHDTIVDEPMQEIPHSAVSAKDETPPAPTAGEETGASALRAELAALFGIGGASDSGRMVPPPIPEYADTSEPAGNSRAVSLSFGTDASTIVSSASSADAEAEPNEPAAESEDFVKDYMEQLLARSRKSAGTTLPQELKSDSKRKSGASGGKSEAAAPKQEQAPKLPKVTSFIEQYMANGYGDLGSAATAVVPAADGSAADANSQVPSTPRQKMDLQKLRENMDSFRSLSTQSVEKAIVHSTLKRERHNINGRIMLSVVLGTMTVFLAIANFKGVINNVVTVWICLSATVVSIAELIRKMSLIRSKCRETLQPDPESRTASRKAVDAEVSGSALNPVPDVTAAAAVAEKPKAVTETPASHPVQSPVSGSSKSSDQSAAIPGINRLMSPGDSAELTGNQAVGGAIRGVESLSAAEELLRSIAQQGPQPSTKASSTTAASRPRYTVNDSDEESQYFEL
jgi:chromosome segregation ATPase